MWKSIGKAEWDGTEYLVQLVDETLTIAFYSESKWIEVGGDECAPVFYQELPAPKPMEED